VIAESTAAEAVCAHCGASVKTTDVFCSHCGRELKATAPQPREDVFTTLSPALLYYFGTLILLMVYKFTPAFPEGFEGQVVISLLDIGIVIAFWIYARRDLAPLFSFSGLRTKIILLTVIGALAGSGVISLIANWINVSISDDVFYNPYLFEDTQFPLLISVLFICVQPAIFEEVAFRGFLFSNLEKVTSPAGAVYISSFVFGLLHLAFISLIWLVPIGLAFAFLRFRYNTLWYGIMGHFTYNLGITLIEFYQIF
jgi:membrane protease YdiL (CAAX protease family)